MAINPHMFWLGGACLVAVMLLPRPAWRDVVRTAQIAASAGLVYAYGAVVYLTGTRTIRVTEADLDAYATVSGPGGLLTTLVSLHGFWRDFPDQARTAVPAAVAVLALAAAVTLVVVGLARLVAVRDPLGPPVVALGVVGLVLASGVSGPVDGGYRWAFEHLPLFEAMREQQKWLALTVVAAAVGAGAAVEWLVGRVGAGAGVVAAAVPLVCAPALLWGLGGTVSTSTYPTGWYEADAAMGGGQELALFLPWHGYQPFGFTDDRSVATPAEAFFRRPVLSGDAVELERLRTDSVSLRQAYLDQLVADGGGGTSFGRLVAPLGVRYVVLSTEKEADRYTWLARQRDLRLVLRTDTVLVYEVTVRGDGRVVSSRLVPGLPRALALAAADELGTEAVVTGGSGLGAAAVGRGRRAAPAVRDRLGRRARGGRLGRGPGGVVAGLADRRPVGAADPRRHGGDPGRHRGRDRGVHALALAAAGRAAVPARAARAAGPRPRRAPGRGTAAVAPTSRRRAGRDRSAARRPGR